jgi:hypothetical protein
MLHVNAPDREEGGSVVLRAREESKALAMVEDGRAFQTRQLVDC